MRLESVFLRTTAPLVSTALLLSSCQADADHSAVVDSQDFMAIVENDPG